MKTNASIRQFRCFVSIAANRSFTRAAAELGITQSALTSAIKELEANLGVRLLYRTTRVVELTEAGEEFLSDAQRVIKEFDAAVANMQSTAGGARGHLAISCAPSVLNNFVSEKLSLFMNAYPNITITLREGTSRDIYGHVRSGLSEIGFTGNYGEDPYLNLDSIAEDAFGFLVPPGIAMPQDDIDIEQLLGLRYIELFMDNYVRERISSLERLRPIWQKPFHVVHSTNSLYNLLKLNGSFSIVPELVSKSDHFSDFSFRKVPFLKVFRKICLLTSKERETSPSARRFLDIAAATRFPTEPQVTL